jgi:hypothetical protein
MRFVQKRRCLVSFCVLVGLVVLALHPSVATAQDAKEPEKGEMLGANEPLPLGTPFPTEPKATPLPTEENWYGWKILTSAGASVVVPLAIVSVESSDLGAISALTVGIGGYFLGGPIVHWAHGSLWKGFASLGINVAGGLVGLAGLGLSTQTDNLGAAIALGLGGFGVGIVGAILVDSFVLAYEPVTEPEGTSFNIGLSVGLNGLSVVGQF